MHVDTRMATIARLAGFALLVLLSRPGLAQYLAITNARIAELAEAGVDFIKAVHQADMVIVAGDPLDDIGAIGDVAAVIQAGRIALDSGSLARRESQARR